MAASKIRVLALDLDGTLTNSEKKITPATRAALEAAMEQGVTVVLASGRPTAGIRPVAEELALSRRGGCILSYNGGAITDCVSGKILYQNRLPADIIPALCAFAAEQGAAILSYNSEGIVTESPEDPWVQVESRICRIPVLPVKDLASYIDYPVNKMLVTLDPARMPEVEAAMKERFAGKVDVYHSTPYFIEVVPLGVAKDASLASLLDTLGLTRENLMACGDGMNDRSMIRFAGVGVAMQNAEQAVKDAADYVTQADNDHDGVAEAIHRFILADG